MRNLATMHLVRDARPKRTIPRREVPAVQGFAASLLDTFYELWRTWLARQQARSAAVPELQLVETLALGPKKHLVLVSCAGERFLVGTGAETVQAIVRLGQERRPTASADQSLDGSE